MRDDVDRGQVPLDSQQGGFGDIAGAALGRETEGYGERSRTIWTYSLTANRSFSRRPGRHFLDMRIAGSDLALCVGNLAVMRPACFSDLPVPLGFAAAVIVLGLAEFFPGFLAGGLVPLLAAEHPLESSRRVRFEVRPLRRRRGDRELAEVQRRNLGATAQGGDADPRISSQRRSQQALQLRDFPLHVESPGSSLSIPGCCLLRRAVALSRLVSLLGSLGSLLLFPLLGCPFPV